MANNDWWSRKMGTEPARRPLDPAPLRPAVTNPGISSVLPVPVKAQSSRQTENCPGCFSPNYMAPQGTQMKRCYDCGYPLVQSGTGTGIQTEPGVGAAPARQVNKSSTYNPNIIVDRIG